MARRTRPRSGQPRPEDRELDVGNDWEVWNWANIFKVTEQELRDVVAKVGPAIADLKRHFGREP
jgi:hypothetical protein